MFCPPSKPSRRDDSDEGSPRTLSMRNKKNHPEIIIKCPLFSTALVMEWVQTICGMLLD